ncbi:MAG: thermonuclease family protein [Candidatus Omnitrophica bacterium]|nr:thermonuclease family protein [Candidatus Omnitrophota bacterium]
MRKKKYILIIIVFLVVGFAIARLLQRPPLHLADYNKGVYVSHVVDGDTVELSNGEKVRYIGIDTPELRKRKGSGWIYDPMPYAEEAKDFNRKLVEGKDVRLRFDVQKRDKYGRILAYVYQNDIMVNIEMVRQGYAMIYTYPPNVKYVEDFLIAQKEARENNRGLWGEMEERIISPYEAEDNVGMIRMVEAGVISTYLSDRVLTLNCLGNFKVVIFKNNLEYFPKMASRSPDTYFKHKAIRVYGVIKEYKGAYEIVLHDPSQLEIL